MSDFELLKAQGFFLKEIVLPTAVREQVIERDWNQLDQLIRVETLPGGCVFDELLKYEQFSQIEFIISIRSSNEELDEDGIWHDDGSRPLAFSLSLTLKPEEIDGGKLEIKKKSDEKSRSIETPSFGTMIVFATGQSGFEHKINKVSKGERLIIAGWCT